MHFISVDFNDIATFSRPSIYINIKYTKNRVNITLYLEYDYLKKGVTQL